jgi:hypothetical protein
LSFWYNLSLVLKCLIATCFTLFILFPFIWLRSCNHCNLACFLLSNSSEYAPLNHSLCCFSS